MAVREWACEWVCEDCGEYFDPPKQGEPETCPFCDSEDVCEVVT